MASSNEDQSIIPDNAWDKGLEMRKAVVGKDYVERSLAKGTSEYTQPMQQFVTEVGWGAFWTRPGLEKKQRSLLNIGMLIALKSWPELTIHTKGAIRNGLTDLEVREAVLQTFLYCGAPAGLEAMRVTEKAIKEMIESGEADFGTVGSGAGTPYLKRRDTGNSPDEGVSLDYFSVIACGLQSPWVQSLRNYAERRRGLPEAWSWVLRDNVSVETAALTNAALAHSAIRDDMHLKSNSHIGGITISAALAMAQRDDWTGDQLLRAIVAAYDVSAILGTAVQQSPGYNRHMRPSGTIGAFGVAAVAIAATDVGEDVAVNALAFAANMASGFNQWAWSGTLEIFTEMGTASQQGIVAFDLANAGMLCSGDVLEGRAGYFAAFSASKGEELFRRGLERPIGAGIDDVRFKPIPGCNYIQTPASVTLKLAKQCDASKIESVTVGCTSGAKNYPGCDFAGPFATVLQTKMSIQFAVCAVLIHADTSEGVFNKTNDKAIETLTSKCTVEALDEYKQPFEEGRQPARVEVKLADGSMLKEELSDVPWLDADQVQARFQAEVTAIVPSPDALKQLLAEVQDLRAVKSASDIVALYG